MELKLNIPIHIVWEKEAAVCHQNNGKRKGGSITVRNAYPEYPCPSYEVTSERSLKKIDEWVADALYDMYPKLESILEKDSVQCFLRLFANTPGRGMSWDLSISAQTLTYMVSYNALRCAKAALEGKAAELYGRHANPNCINAFGYFPLHEAAERFSVEMIKLLLCHKASANVRTVGNAVIPDLLPLHVAVEKTCLHKYMEDNLSPKQDHLDYIYKLIHLLCLPEMKVFLDTTRLLAENTNNLVDEIWNYMKCGRIIQSTVLLLAAQDQIRGGCSYKKNGSTKKDGLILSIIVSSDSLLLLDGIKAQMECHRIVWMKVEHLLIAWDCLLM